MGLLGERSMFRRTWAAGTWASGSFTKGAATDTTIRGTWRPMPAQQAQQLASGERERDPRVLYTSTELTIVRQGSGLSSDYVSPDSGTTLYEVMSKADGTEDTALLSPIAHWKYVCLRVKENDA